MSTSSVMQKCSSILDTIGETPLVQLSRFFENKDFECFAKLESFNPGGSAKDRPAFEMIHQAMLCGEIDEETIVIESSSGNMGIGLAQICRYFGLKFLCVVDPHIQETNKKMLRALGAELICVKNTFNGSYLAARLNEIQHFLATNPNAYWPNQYANEANPFSHACGTISEIFEELNGDFDYLFVATSSTGTLQGCQDYLRQRGSRAIVVAVDSTGSVLFGGERGERLIPGLGAGQVPELALTAEPDEMERVSDLDCVVGCRRLVANEAILAGGSAGGVLQAMRRRQHDFTGKKCVAILHDSGSRYLDTVYNDKWVCENLKCELDYLNVLVADYELNHLSQLSN